MTFKSAVAPIARAGLTERELLMVAAAFSSQKGDQVIDWDKFTPLAGYASNNSARVCFRPLLKKLNAFAERMADLGEDADNVADTQPPTTPASMKKTPTPGSKGRGRPKKRKTAEKEDGAADGEGGNTSTNRPAGIFVKDEPAANQPEPGHKKIKLEDICPIDAFGENKEQSESLEQPPVVSDTASTTGVSHALMGAPAAEVSQECLGLCESRVEGLDFDFSEYVHQDAFE